MAHPDYIMTKEQKAKLVELKGKLERAIALQPGKPWRTRRATELLGYVRYELRRNARAYASRFFAGYHHCIEAEVRLLEKAL